MTEESYEKWRQVELERGVPQPTWGQLSPEEQAALEGPEEKPADDEWPIPEGFIIADDGILAPDPNYVQKPSPRMVKLVDAPPDSDEGELG